MTVKPTRHTAQNGRTTYKVRFRGPRKKGGWGPTSETFDSKREADQFAKWLDALGPQGALDQLYAAEQQRAVPTVDVVAADHIRLLTGVTEGTRLNYERLWARTWGKHLGHIQANRVTADDVRAAVNALAVTYSRKSLENQRGLLVSVLDRAIELGHLHKNPAKGIALPKAGETAATEMRVLTWEEFDAIVAAVPEHYRPLVNFLGATGARWGEAIALQVGDVALPNVRIRRALKWSPDNRRVTGAPKTRRGNRTVKIPGEVRDELAAACEGKPRDALVFTAPRGGPVLHRTFWSRVWLPATAMVDEPRPRIHDLRHSHASWLLAAGVPIHIVSLRLGHNDIRTTVNIYGHLLPDAQTQAAEAASLVFGGKQREIES